ncbi:glycosyltransferase family 4 protein [Prosthecobacter sp.]|uniref:glycosyltransferase family 4 protein n=1 Tax=Prosthecobacter sp. TaxID=1965333 RepID=UPI003783A4D2
MSIPLASDPSGGVELAYIGVHEIFQMAIAAEELGCLSGLQCSVFDAPGKWGHFLSRFAYLPSAFPLGSKALPPGKVHELPLPQMARQMMQKVFKRRRADPLPYLQAFERQAARRLRHSNARIAVAAETCALGYFRAAKELGMRCMLDSHGIPAPFLDAAVQRAAAEFDLSIPPPSDSAAMTAHKEQERALADVILFCSELQREHWVRLGVPAEKCQTAPLWVDTEFWKPLPRKRSMDQPLQVAAVGCGSLAKGLPYLLTAAAPLKGSISLTLVGHVDAVMLPLLQRCPVPPKRLPYMSRPQLRDFFNTQDVLVMPSLGDSFGLVAMEAMACGLPVIVTTHCGLPVPDPAWRVPALDSGAITERLNWYAEDRERAGKDGLEASLFAAQFTPRRYRDQIKAVYRGLLDGIPEASLR